ncbi:MAG TPA: CopD family protein [Methylomirabilota bacterium]|nr:CopD family protein [Methylomirabilota bacterium]
MIVLVLGLVVRFIHLASCVLLLGGGAMLLLAGRSDRPTALAWEVLIIRAARALALVAILSGLGALAHQTITLEGRAHAALEPAAVVRVLLHTQSGHVWLLRHGLLLVLAAFLLVRAELRDRLDWRAARGEAVLLAAAALGLIAAAGHAAAVEPGTTAAILADAAHLLAAGMWLGALPALALLLAAASREDGADARPYAVLAARRFSRWALVLVLALIASGVVNALGEIGTVAGLLGTAHGRLLLAKLALFVPILILARVNRRLVPALSGAAATVGRPAMRRLSNTVAIEAVLGAVILVVVAVMTVTPPARHAQPVWPLHFRFSYDNVVVDPTLRPQVFVGSQLAVLGVVGLLATLLLRRTLRLPVGAGAAVLLAGGLAVALPPLVSDAYPTTYQRPAVPYHASSIADGGRLYAAHCAGCHGPEGAGDGPAGRWMTPRPANLRGHHVALHTAGDLFWWITYGLRQMPAFGERLTEEQRWDLVNFLRALSAADAARALAATVEPDRPRIVAPDFSFSVGPTPPRALKDYRGRRIVLLVLYTLPASRARLVDLAQRYDVLVPLGVEIIAAPTDGAPDAIRRLGGQPPMLFPVVTDGALDIAAAYGLFARAPHAELLIDRQGYLRTRWTAADGARGDVDRLLADVQRLNEEKVVDPAPAEHVH